MDGNISWGIYAHPNLAASKTQHGDLDIFANFQRFTYPASQNQHH
jgi:hypothetical protein